MSLYIWAGKLLRVANALANNIKCCCDNSISSSTGPSDSNTSGKLLFVQSNIPKNNEK